MELHEIVLKLTGPVEAVGETREDERRIYNLKALTDLVDQLLSEISNAARTADRHEASMRAIGRYAKDYLQRTAK